MWLLTLLLASMASGCPDLCKCHTEGEFQQVVCYGKTVFGDAQLADVSHLGLNATDESGVANLFDHLQNGTGLSSLALVNSSLCSLNVSWVSCEALRHLNLSYNHFTDVHEAIGEDGYLMLSNLTVLDLSHNQLEEIEPESFSTFGDLHWLRLRSNVISKVDERGFEGLTNLEDLDLANNHLDTLPSGALAPLDALQKLDLSGNKLQVLGASWFETLTRLRELDVSRNGLAKAASGVLQPLPGLSVLRLAENPLRERDVSLLLGTGRRLETVDASRTGLVRVPAALTRSVRTLRLAGNKLMSIRGGDLDSYPLLRLLDLSNNRLTTVEEDALGRLEVLEDLDISGNILPNVPRSLPSSLVTLDLSRNAIGVVRFTDLQGLYNLRNLSLNDNAISTMEEGSLSQLPSLHMLDISNNPIKLLSVNALTGPNDLAILKMSGLSQLEDHGKEGDMAFPVPAPERLLLLDVSRSPILAGQLLTDDAALSACKSLEILDLSYTNVSHIRLDLTYVMPQLRSFGLAGNEWNCTLEQFWLGDWLRQHSEMLPRSRCAVPDEFAGKYLFELPSIAPTTTIQPQITSNPSMSSSTQNNVSNMTPIYQHATDGTSDEDGISTDTTTSLSSTVPTSTVELSSSEDTTEMPELRAFKRVFLSTSDHSDISNTIAEELNAKVTDPGARMAPEPFSAGPHPGMLVLAGAALTVAAAMTILLSRRASRRDKYHRHENIEVHSLTPTTELW